MVNQQLLRRLLRHSRWWAVFVFMVGCGHPGRLQRTWTEQFRAPATIRTAEDVRLAQDEFDASSNANRRLLLRDQIEEYLTHQIDFAMAAKQVEEVRELFLAALRNYRGYELEHPPTNPRLLRLAERAESFFRQRGRIREVLAALSVQITFRRDASASINKFREISDWVCGGGTGDVNRMHVIHFVESLEEVARNFPSPWVLQSLLEKYRAIFQLPPKTGESEEEIRPAVMPSPLRFGRRAFAEASLFLRVPSVSRALEAIGHDNKLPGDEAPLVHLLEQADRSGSTDADWLALSEYFAQQDNLDIMLAANIVEEGLRHFPRSWNLNLWAGRYAIVTNRLHAAINYFESAIALAPERWDGWEAVPKLYEVALVRMSSQDNVDVNMLEGIFRRVREIYVRAHAQFPDKALAPSEDELRFQVIRGYYHAGKLTEAQRELGRMSASSLRLRVADLQAQISLRLEQPREARSFLDTGESGIATLKPADQVWWQAKFARLRAESYDLEKDVAHAQIARKAALGSWAKLISQDLNPEALAEAHTERARLLYGLNDRSAAFDAIQTALDVAPTRATTYADMIAFLVIRGELVLAEEIFHRIAARPEMTDYLKVYCSLWISDLAERQGQPPDAMALAYLKSVKGSEWYHDLAGWATGTLDDAGLLARADTPAKRAELAFYQGLRAYRKGQRSDALRFWQAVIHSRLVAFFEYDMAGFYLRLGGAPMAPLLAPSPPTKKAHSPTAK